MAGSKWRRAKPSALAGAALVLAAAVALAWWEGAHRYSTTPAQVGVIVAVVVLLPTAFVLGWGRQKMGGGAWIRAVLRSPLRWRELPPAYRAGVIVWIVIAAAVVGWDLLSFLTESHTLPTLSYYSGRITRFHVGKTIEFLAWLAAGTYLVAGWRRTQADPPCSD